MTELDARQVLACYQISEEMKGIASHLKRFAGVIREAGNPDRPVAWIHLKRVSDGQFDSLLDRCEAMFEALSTLLESLPMVPDGETVARQGCRGDIQHGSRKPRRGNKSRKNQRDVD